MMQTIHLSQNQLLAAAYHHLLFSAPNLTEALEPGHFIQIQHPDTQAWSSTLPIMQTHPTQTDFSVFASPIDAVWENILKLPPNMPLVARVPLGTPLQATTPRLLLLGEQVYMGALLFFAARHRTSVAHTMLVLLESDAAFAFAPRPSQIHMPDLPPDVIASLPLLEDWDIASRLAHPMGLPGCFDGSVMTLATLWLQALPPTQIAEVTLIVAGRTAFLIEAQRLAEQYGLGYQAAMVC